MGIPRPKGKDKPKKDRKKTSSQLKKLLDKVFSEFIRRKYADKEGKIKCYTCPKVLKWQELQCGHFVSRQHLATRYDEENVRPQCIGCNIFGGGKVSVFANNLEFEREGIVNALYRKSSEIIKSYPYEQKIIYYKEKIKQLER